MQSITTLNLNLQYPNYTTTMYAVQHDRLSRKITAMLFDGSVPFEPEYGTLAVVRYKKPDGTCGFYDTDEDGNTAVTWDGNTATIMLAEQALTVAGTVLCQVQFYNGEEQRLSSFTWKINVEENACTDDTITSSDYFNILTQQIASILEVVTDMPAPSTILPLMDGTATIGIRGEFARSDHVHPTDTSITDKIGDTPLTTTAQTLTGGINELNLSSGLNRGDLPSNVTSADDIAKLPAGVYRCENVSTSLFPTGWGVLQIIKTGSYGEAIYYPTNNTSRVCYRRAIHTVTGTFYESSWIGVDFPIPVDRGGTGATTAANARRNLGLAYAVNDTHTTSNSQVISGFFTSSATAFIGDYYAEASIADISTVTITVLTGLLRGTNGSVETTASTDFTTGNYTATATKLSSHRIRIQITKNSAFSNATNNTPASYWGNIGLKFT